MVIYGNPGTGRVHSTVQPIPEARAPGNKRGAKRKPVIIDGIRFKSAREAAQAYGIKPDTLRVALRRGRSVCQGHAIRIAS